MILVWVAVRILDLDQEQALHSAKMIAGVYRAVLQSTIAIIRIAFSEVAPFPDHHQPGMGLQAGGAWVTM